MNLLVITPHLSTGGCPQYLLEYLKHNQFQYTNVKVIEFSNFSNDYVVQKNKIKNLIGSNNVICLGDFWVSDEQFKNDKFKLLDIITSYKPDVVWFNEFPECFEYKLPPKELMAQIYDKNRSYKIIETTHHNSFDFGCKIYLPDEFMFCSELHIEKSKNLNIKKTVWEIPIGDNIRPDRRATLESLGLDPNYLHVLNVGIINPNKNQKYIFELAEQLKFYKIKFHFIGNTCFLNDCGISPDHLSQDNCIMWGERSDVEVFMSCMDVFLFPSHNELNPLSVKEALSWNMNVVCKKCDNYTYKYINKSNFHLLENINTKNFLIDNLKILVSTKRNENKYKKFALYTSFYNCEKYVDQIFNQIQNLKYENFTWFITDDFSSDNTKIKIFEKLNSFPSSKIKYVTQSFKKQMYWRPNSFVPKDYEYIVLIDVDDYFDYNFLNIYNKYLSEDSSIYILTSDFNKMHEASNELHSLSLISNEKSLKERIKNFHPTTDYLNNLNYYCFGTLRCFKNVENLTFEISDFNACAEDSYRVMYTNSLGKLLHLPRNLYSWRIRNGSESHSQAKENFNANFDIAYNKLLNSDALFDDRFSRVYKETCALNFLPQNINFSISLFSKNANLNIIKDLYFDVKLSVNDFERHDYYVIVLNYYTEKEIENILTNISNKDSKVLFYWVNDAKVFSNHEKDKLTNDYLNNFLNFSHTVLDSVCWFSYIRHIFVWGTPQKKNLYYKKSIADIINQSGSLGDFLAWTPIVSEYAKQKNIEVNYYTPYKNLLQDSYKNVNFYNYNQKENIHSKNLINLGCFDNIPWQKMNLQEIASNILGVEHKEARPQISEKFKKQNNFSKKYVCIATQSTAQCKYWNNPNGWQQVVDYLKSLDYEVVCIDRHENFGIPSHMNTIPKNCINKTGDLPLEDRINDLMHCEFFIGLGSGLSWLAWACNKPVVMISGFSDPKSEFYTPYRVHDKNVCNSCWNDPNHKFDPANWLWCPQNKDFECSKEISFEMVREKIDLCIKDLQKNNLNTYNLKCVHILVDTESEREKLSIESMQKINDKIPYIKCINKKYEGTDWKSVCPIGGFKNHGPGHYGAFQSFKKAILENFTDDLNGLLIFEADCVLKVSIDKFLSKVNEAMFFCEKYNLPYFSFGPRVVNGFLESNCLNVDKDYPDFIITDKIILAHCVLITKKYRNYIFEQLEKSWDSPDLWFNEIFKNFNMGIVKDELAYQTHGFSMIDNCFKWSK